MSRKRATSAGEFYVSGRQFYFAFELIVSNPRFYEVYQAAILSASENAAFCVECLLKALIIKSGSKIEDVTTPSMGHNLNNLYHLCVDRGYNLDGLLIKHVVEDLHPMHDDFRFRYFEQAHKYGIRGHLEVLGALQKLDHFVRAAVSDELSD